LRNLLKLALYGIMCNIQGVNTLQLFVSLERIPK